MKLNMFADFTDRIPLEQRLALIKDSGFDGVMLGFAEDVKYTQYETADKLGLEIENVHSPFDRMNALWVEREDTEPIFRRTLECIDICADNGIKKIVVHPTDGLVPPPMTELGLKNFERLLDRAAARGVTLLFENIQLPAFVDLLFRDFGDCPNMGFCYDVGHESCFTPGEYRLPVYGSRLGALHIHDNDGKNDQHLIPFDGVIDMGLFLKELKETGYTGPMSLELYMTKSDRYTDITPEEFTLKAAQAGRRLIDMLEQL